MIRKLKIKETIPYILIQFGFYLVLILLTFLIQGEARTAVRILILEWGAFPMLCAITGGVMAQKEGFLPLYGISAAVLFAPFMYFFFDEFNPYVLVMYTVMGYAGTLFGYFLFRKEVNRIEKGLPKKERKRSWLFKLLDRHDIDQYR